MISSVLLSTVSVLNILCLLTSWSSCQSVPRLVRGRAHAVCVVGLPVGVEVAAPSVARLYLVEDEQDVVLVA